MKLILIKKNPHTEDLFLSSELSVSQVEPLFDSVIRTYYKLDELGIKEVDGQIVFIDNMEVSHE